MPPPGSLSSTLSQAGQPSIPYTVHLEVETEGSTPTSPPLENGISSPTHLSGELIKSRPSELNLRHTVDLRGITYDGTVDENLMCPICRCPLINPVLTDCDHIFCRECIDDSLSHSKLCPIDRLPLSQDDLFRAPKMVFNQLDSLKAKCPCCGISFARSMLENHMEKYCPESLVRCPSSQSEKGCTEFVKRRVSSQGCLHYQSHCPDCSEAILQIQMEDHRDKYCVERLGACEHCNTIILKQRREEHERSCIEIVEQCKWARYGCPHEGKRKGLDSHLEDCTFKVFGPMAEMLKKEISDLRTEQRSLAEANHLQERRIKFLESGQRASDRPLEFMDLSLGNLPDTASSETLDSGHEYLLALLEAQQSRLSTLSAELSDLQAKNTMMLFNETLPIKNELAELRSTQQVTCMHVRWLMRFRMQENQRRFGGGPSLGPPPPSGGPDGGGPSSDMSPSLSRRLSDSGTRDLITKL
ncbi:hypothetical protein BGZ60DRAFT_398044 [Tricladium varicosporioides]|nr:hypothetical protein BGZ60DRAFT_398044 [Hymenoscyphus varicosporioides]